LIPTTKKQQLNTTMAMLPPPFLLPEKNKISETIGVDGEMNSFSLTVVYAPRALRRSKFVLSRMYAVNPDSRELATFKELLKKSFEEGKTFPYYASKDTPIYLAITFRMRRPNSHYVNANRTNRIKSRFATAVPTKMDLDNMVKFVMDAANTIIYHDDKQVTHLIANKVYHEDATSIGSVTVAVNVVI
jgi:Holliday junction resolvase RusA-like endonuclease